MSVSSEKELLDTKTLIIFCIDISGSMANDKFNNPFKWTQTKQATMDCINDQKEKNPKEEKDDVIEVKGQAEKLRKFWRRIHTHLWHAYCEV